LIGSMAPLGEIETNKYDWYNGKPDDMLGNKHTVVVVCCINFVLVAVAQCR